MNSSLRAFWVSTLVLLSTPAWAQSFWAKAAGTGPGSLDLERLRLGLDREAILDVESASVGQAALGKADIGFFLGYANSPFRGLAEINNRRTFFQVVSHRFTAHVTSSWLLHRRWRVGLELPIVLTQLGAPTLPGVYGPNPVAATALGDLRVVSKNTLWSHHGLSVAFLAHVTAPTAFPRQNYVGDGLPTLAAELAVSGAGDWVRWAGNVGPKFRFPSTFGAATQGQELGFRLGAGFGPSKAPWEFDVSLSGAALWAPNALSEGNNPLEGLMGARYSVSDWQWFAVAGAGIPNAYEGSTSGVGSPRFRVVGGLRFAPRLPPPAPPVRVAEAPPPPPPAPEPVPEVLPPPPPPPAPVVVARFSLNEKVAFWKGSARLKQGTTALLRRMMETVQTKRLTLRYRIEGHTDSTGPVAVNERLSLARAEAVKDALKHLGVPESVMTVAGFAATRPLAPNETPQGRALNRRVEIIVEE